MDKTPPLLCEPVWRCVNCQHIYQDQGPTQCDCMPDKQEYEKGLAKFGKALTELPVELCCIAETVDGGGGFWRSCSGCHETNEGHDTGPFSQVFRCALGLGCSECGGIGAVWDTTDYNEMAEHMLSMEREEQSLSEITPSVVIDGQKLYGTGQLKKAADIGRAEAEAMRNALDKKDSPCDHTNPL